MQEIKQFSLRLQISLWLPVVVYASFIFYLSSLSETGFVVDIIFLDKFLHALEYSIFGLLLMRAFYNTSLKLESKKAFVFSIIVAFLYAITDEIHQSFVIGRSATISDALFDFLGASLGSYLYYLRRGLRVSHD